MPALSTRIPTVPALAVAALLIAVAACGDNGSAPVPIDTQLRQALAQANVTPLTALPAQPPALVTLGQALMFDKILSGNKDISCGTCHRPLAHTGDTLTLSIGTGGTGLGAGRMLGTSRVFIARNAPELFNRGYSQFTQMFWDGRVSGTPGSFVTPAGALLPPGLNSALAAQAMFPVTNRDEMRGQVGDLDVNGAPNELADSADNNLPGIWAAIMARLLNIPAYVTLFDAAYPGLPHTFEQAANAIAAFEIAGFTRINSPFDQYLAGANSALTDAEKRGALTFYGRGLCSRCHSGSHLTNQQFSNIGVPQLGPGRPPGAPLDFGRENPTGVGADRYKFKTPPLRNVELTAPDMHDGAYATLEAAVRHYKHLPMAQQRYDSTQADARLLNTPNGYHNSAGTVAEVTATLDARIASDIDFTDTEINEMVAFLEALTDPTARDLSTELPATVPSGLPVDR
ncbi:MAG: cytochrome-c peroxidase [Gemmatimonadales bacterium]